MTAVFLAGSRKLGRLNEQIRERIDNLIAQNFLVLVGDANGADKAVQKYLSESNYSHVIVFCSGPRCRNNVGDWETRNVFVDPTLKGRSFYTQKDKKMAEDADFGFFIWDGKSSGTLNNIVALLKYNKKSLVYFSPGRIFLSVASITDMEKLLERCLPSDVEKIRKKIALTKQINEVISSSQAGLNF
jgi:hypothetical protein